MQGTTTSQDIFEKDEQVLHEHDIDLSKLACLSADGAANMVSRHNGIVAKLQAKIIRIHHLHILTVLFINIICVQIFQHLIICLVWSQRN